jgi:hypothetical protein
MRNLPNHQSGFGAIGVIAIVAVIVIIGAAGFGVYKHHHKTTDATTSTATPNTPPATPVQNPTITSTTTPATTVQQTKKIPELGVKLNIPDSLGDLTYYVRDVQLSNGGTTKGVTFSTTALTNADSKCSAEYGPLGGFVIGQGQYPVSDPNVTADYGKLVKQFQTSFVGFSTSQGGCSTDPKANVISGDAETAFHQAVQTVELLK